MLPQLTHRDLVLRRTSGGWRIEDAAGRQLCDTVWSTAEARLVGRTFVPVQGRLWMCVREGWVLVDDD